MCRRHSRDTLKSLVVFEKAPIGFLDVVFYDLSAAPERDRAHFLSSLMFLTWGRSNMANATVRQIWVGKYG